MEARQCASCGQHFTPRPQSPTQSYCANPKCQRVRQQRWQKAKLISDPDYRENQARAYENWCVHHPDYWRRYRACNPKYAKRNRILQHTRNSKSKKLFIAKSDVSNPSETLDSGIYRISLVSPDEIAKIDAWIVRITVLAAG
jgi:endogenous inhibitor of DNA gyrase (YacG/DUF329 family)